MSYWLVGKKVILFPADTHPKEATVLAVDGRGTKFRITKGGGSGAFKTGDVVYFNHAKELTLTVLDEEVTA